MDYQSYSCQKLAEKRKPQEISDIETRVNQAQENGDELSTCLALLDFGEATLHADRYRCLQITQEALAIATNLDDPGLRARALVLLSDFHFTSRCYAHAKSWALRGESHAQVAADAEIHGRSLVHLGKVYAALEEWVEAYEFFDRAHTVAFEGSCPDVLDWSLAGIATCLVRLERFNEAITTARTSLVSVLPERNPNSYQRILLALGLSLRHLGHLKDAHEIAKQGMDFVNEHGSGPFSWRFSVLKAETDFALGEDLKALEHLTLGCEWSQEWDNAEGLGICLRASSEIYASRKNFEMAYRTLLDSNAEREKVVERDLTAKLHDQDLVAQEVTLQLEERMVSEQTEELDGFASELSTLDQARQQLKRKVFEASVIDDLTGILNRKAFIREALMEMERVKHMDGRFTVLLFDVMAMKQINAKHGMFVGDKVIASLAEVMKVLIRKGDILGRLEGGEFCIILPETTVGSTIEIGERILEGCRAFDWEPIVGSDSPKVSGGICTVRSDHRSFFEILQEAEIGVDEAKAGGGDQLRVHNERLHVA